MLSHRPSRSCRSEDKPVSGQDRLPERRHAQRMLQAALPASWPPCRPRDIHRRRSPPTSARLPALWRWHAPGGWWRPICLGRPHRAAGMSRHLPLRPRRQRGRALGRAPDDPASGQPTTTPFSDRHLGVAVRRGSTPRYGSPRQRPRRAARAQDAPAAPGHRALCSQDPRAKSRTGAAAATAATAWVTAVEMSFTCYGPGSASERGVLGATKVAQVSAVTQIRAAARSGQRDAVR